MTNEELIAEARRRLLDVPALEPGERAEMDALVARNVSTLIRRLADALEAATRERDAVPDAATERDLRSKLSRAYRQRDEEREAKKGNIRALNKALAERDAALAAIERVRAIASDPCTDGCCDVCKGKNEGWEMVLEALEEGPELDPYDDFCPTCDAPEPWHTDTCAVPFRPALAAIERIRRAVAGHPECDRYEEGDVISCGWKSAYASVVAALDGAPEPEDEPEEEMYQAGCGSWDCRAPECGKA